MKRILALSAATLAATLLLADGASAQRSGGGGFGGGARMGGFGGGARMGGFGGGFRGGAIGGYRGGSAAPVTVEFAPRALAAALDGALPAQSPGALDGAEVIAQAGALLDDLSTAGAQRDGVVATVGVGRWPLDLGWGMGWAMPIRVTTTAGHGMATVTSTSVTPRIRMGFRIPTAIISVGNVAKGAA